MYDTKDVIDPVGFTNMGFALYAPEDLMWFAKQNLETWQAFEDDARLLFVELLTGLTDCSEAAAEETFESLMWDDEED